MDDMSLAIERRAALNDRVLELDDFIRTAEGLLSSFARRVPGGDRRREGGGIDDEIAGA